MAQEWYIVEDGKAVGPFPSLHLRKMAQAGKLLPQTLVALAGSDRWFQAGEVPGLKEAFADAPSAAPTTATTPNAQAVPPDRKPDSKHASHTDDEFDNDHESASIPGPQRGYAEATWREFLFDHDFEKFITPKAVKAMWLSARMVIGLLAVLMVVASLLGGLANLGNNIGVGIFLILIAPALVLAVAVWLLLQFRIWMELIIIRFYEGRSAMRDHAARAD